MPIRRAVIARLAFSSVLIGLAGCAISPSANDPAANGPSSSGSSANASAATPPLARQMSDGVPATIAPGVAAEYRAAVEAIAISDQEWRTMVSWGTDDPDELARLEALDNDASMAEWGRRNAEGISLPKEKADAYMAKQNVADRANCEQLLSLVERLGWPSEDRLGLGTPDMTAVLIHMPMDMMGEALPLLRREALAGRMPPKRYAVVYDRKQQHDGAPQLYGTSQAFDPATRTVLPPAITDIDATNLARAEIGLEPLTEYRVVPAGS
ncbi:MAG: DUF6624 domain-containing protein [Phycisphaerales bacterium]